MNKSFYENNKFYVHSDIYEHVLHCIITSNWNSQIKKEYSIIKSKRPGKSWVSFILPYKNGPKNVVYTIWYKTESHKQSNPLEYDNLRKVQCDGIMWY